jgi:hypothetical protein
LLIFFVWHSAISLQFLIFRILILWLLQ